MSYYSKKYLFLLLGWLSLGLGFIGIFLPILPTTPFVILAAYFFNKGSVKIHQWLLSNRYFGDMIRDWEHARVIRLSAKIYSTSMIIPLFSYTLIFVKIYIWVKFLILLIGIFVLFFIWSRSSGDSNYFLKYKISSD
jgi:uncharacterized protein